MTANWVFAALSELIYRRNTSDQRIDFPDITPDISPVGFSDGDAGALGLRVHDQFYLYNDSGFEAVIVRNGNDFIIVFRGTDTALDTEEIIAGGLIASAPVVLLANPELAQEFVAGNYGDSALYCG
ncbi:MAG: hypothetical protein U5J99_15240 [Parvularculaceae bacterium]|nr:hypothetical protein [Parvularculaceae bacterium]